MSWEKKGHLASGRNPTCWIPTLPSEVSGCICGHGTRSSAPKGSWGPKHYHWLCYIGSWKGWSLRCRELLASRTPCLNLLLYRHDPEPHASLMVLSRLHGDRFHNDLRSGTELETKSPPQLLQGLQTPFIPFPRVLRGPLSPTSSAPTFKARASEPHPSGAFNSVHCPRGCVA